VRVSRRKAAGRSKRIDRLQYQVEVKGGQLIDDSLTVSPIAIKKSLDSSRKVPLRRGEMMQVISNLI
jgi:hypothetical protein